MSSQEMSLRFKCACGAELEFRDARGAWTWNQVKPQIVAWQDRHKECKAVLSVGSSPLSVAGEGAEAQCNGCGLPATVNDDCPVHGKGVAGTAGVPDSRARLCNCGHGPYYHDGTRGRCLVNDCKCRGYERTGELLDGLSQRTAQRAVPTTEGAANA